MEIFFCSQRLPQTLTLYMIHRLVVVKKYSVIFFQSHQKKELGRKVPFFCFFQSGTYFFVEINHQRVDHLRSDPKTFRLR